MLSRPTPRISIDDSAPFAFTRAFFARLSPGRTIHFSETCGTGIIDDNLRLETNCALRRLLLSTLAQISLGHLVHERVPDVCRHYTGIILEARKCRFGFVPRTQRGYRATNHIGKLGLGVSSFHLPRPRSSLSPYRRIL